MRRFYQLRDQVFTGRWHLGEVTRADGTEPRLRAGSHFNGEGTLFASVTHPGMVLEFCLTSFAVPVASGVLARVVSSAAGPDVQCIPVTIDGNPGMYVLNVVRVVRCLDESRSEFLKWTDRDHRADLAGQYRQVTKLAIDPDAIPSDAHFFRISGWEVAIILSQDVKEAMERVGCVGAEFRDLQTKR